MVLKQVDRLLAAAEAQARAGAARLRSPEALRLRVRLRRWETALMGALLVLGVLLMVIHWSGSHAARPAPAASAARAPMHADAGPDTLRGGAAPPGTVRAWRADTGARMPQVSSPASPLPAPASTP